jgi:plastocyanin
MVDMATYPVLKLESLAGLLLLGIAFPACGGGDGGCCDPLPSTTIAKSAAGSGDAQSGVVGQPLPVAIRVTVTEAGQPRPGATVSWSTTTAGGSLSEPSTTTDNSGDATNTWTLGTVAGPQTAQASLSGAGGSPVTFNATGTPDAPEELSQSGGDGQEGPINSELPELLSVKVSDQYGNGVPGVGVDWATTGDAELSAANVITDASGTSAVGVVLGGTEGSIVITATSEGLNGSPQSFTVTAGPEAPATATVNVVNNSFQPGALTVAAGTTVRWVWSPGASNHNVESSGPEPPGSGAPSSAPDSYEHTFNTPGTYNYFCQVHAGMSGVITVQ